MRSRFGSLLWIWLLCGQVGLFGAIPPDAELVDIQVGGPSIARINLVILGDGYQSDEREKFLTDAGVVADGILSVQPLSNYRQFFNVQGIFVSSAESGSDHPSERVYRDTYFNSTYDTAGVARLLTIPFGSFGYNRAEELLRNFVPDYDIAAVVVNDSEYGGSGGEILVVSTHPASPEIAAHELGHSFAGLGDEYGDAFPFSDTEEPNTTRTTERTQIKWASWILDSTPIPTPATTAHRNEVGLFEGAHYHTNGWYRPKLNCRMRTLGYPFCEVCSQELVRSIYTTVAPMSAIAPATNQPVAIASAVPFGFDLLRPAKNSITVSWSLNGALLSPLVAEKIQLDPTMLGSATNQLVATVEDHTTLVRNSPSSPLRWTVTWQVLYDPATPPIVQAVRAGDKILLSWTALSQGFVVEWTTGLPDSGWQKMDEDPVQEGAEFRVFVPILGDQGYYRVRRL